MIPTEITQGKLGSNRLGLAEKRKKILSAKCLIYKHGCSWF